MADDTDVNWKARGAAFVAYARGHWDWCGPLAGFLAGWLVGKFL